MNIRIAIVAQRWWKVRDKMIKVRKAQLIDGKRCRCCNTQINLTEIKFLENGWAPKPTTIILCNDCINEMMKKLEARWSEQEEED